MHKPKRIINCVNSSVPGLKKVSLHKSQTGTVPAEDFIVTSKDLPNKMPNSKTALSRTVLEGRATSSKSTLFEDWPPPNKMVDIK